MSLSLVTSLAGFKKVTIHSLRNSTRCSTNRVALVRRATTAVFSSKVRKSSCTKCEKSVSTFYCPSLSQTSTVGKVSSVKLFHKLSKNTASRKPTKTSSLQARNYQTTSAVSKTLPGFQNSKQNSKSTNKVKSTSAILYFWINSVHGKQKSI